MWQLGSVQILHYRQCLGAENHQNLPIRKHYIRRQDVGASVTNFFWSILGVRAPDLRGIAGAFPVHYLMKLTRTGAGALARAPAGAHMRTICANVQKPKDS